MQPGGQRGTPLPGDHQHREVPGDDLTGDADRLFAGVAEVVASDGMVWPWILSAQPA